MIYSTSYLITYFFSMTTKIRSAGSGSVIQYYRSVDPDPKEIFDGSTTLYLGIVRNPSISSFSFDILATGIG
jgi:hypothetical protein